MSETTGTAPFSPRRRSDSVSTLNGSRSSATDRKTSSERSRRALGADLCLVSGGLGPTHDDRTVEMVARVARRSLARGRRPRAADRAGLAHVRRAHGEAVHGVRHRRHQAGDASRKARSPSGSRELPRASCSTPTGRPWSWCCPALRASFRRLWPRALETSPVQRVLERAPERGRAVLRFYGTPESAVARALAEAGGDGDGVEATICARDFEIHVDLVFDPDAGRAGGGTGSRASRRARGLSVQRGRALGGRDRPRALPCPRSHARGCRVLHRRPRGGAPDGRRRARATSSGGASWRTRTT